MNLLWTPRSTISICATSSPPICPGMSEALEIDQETRKPKFLFMLWIRSSRGTKLRAAHLDASQLEKRGGLWCPGAIAWVECCLVADDAGRPVSPPPVPQSYQFSKDFLQAFGNGDRAAVSQTMGSNWGCSLFLIPPHRGALGQSTTYICVITSNMKE